MLAAGAALGLIACGDSGTEGGTLKGSYASFPELDPQIAYSAEGWTAMYNTYIPLLTYAHADGEAGSEVVPGLAEDLPRISNGGKTYTLQLRDGLKYSDGSPVKASDFKSSIERMFAVDSGGSFFYTDIVGAEDFQADRADGISGIKPNDRTGEIVVDLNNPRGTFVNELAMPFAAVLPADTPDRDQSANPAPATGPYEIVESNPGKGWSYARNPQWAKTNSKAMPDLPSGHVDRIEIDVVRNQSTQVNDVEQGKSNWMFDPVPADRVGEVRNKYEGTQYRPQTSVSTYFFWMNTTKAPFDDVKVRQAVNYAVDRDALLRIYSGELVPGQQILPPGMPGYEEFELYPHDMAKARQLIAQANPRDRDITVWTDSLNPNDDAGAYYQEVLQQLGFNAKLKVVGGDSYVNLISNTSTPDLDTGWFNWFEDYPHPNDFFQPLLDGNSIQPTGNFNLAQIDVPELNRKIDELNKQQLGSEQEQQYADLDREYMELAPWAPFGARQLSTFVSSDIDLDKVIFNPTFSQDLTSFQFK